MSPRYRRMLLAVIFAAPTLVLPACTSIVTKLYDTDNYTSSEPQKKCLRGLPITMDVPTHVKIVVTETQYWYQIKDTTTPPAGAPTPGAGEGMRYLPTSLQASRSADYNIITKKELFTVDFKRPASGTNDVKVGFTNTTSGGQYPSSISQTVTDNTIQSVAGLIQQLIQSAPSIAASSLSDVGTPPPNITAPNVIAIPHVVAVEFFDIHEPNLEGRIREFLDQQINSCSPVPCQRGNQGGLVPTPVSKSSPVPGSTPSGSVAPTSGIVNRPNGQRADQFGNPIR